MRKCKQCGKPFESKHKQVVFCSHKCANIYSAPRRTKNIILTCLNCDKEFNVKPGDLKYRGTIKFCSMKCAAAYKKKQNTVIEKCDYCKREYEKQKCRVGKHKHNFCSNDCRRKYNKTSPPYKKNGYWFEGGYKVIYIEGNKSIKEHIFIMETKIGRKLTKNEVVHHKNGIRDDNRIENLELMTRSNHTKYHRNKIEPGAKLVLVK